MASVDQIGTTVVGTVHLLYLALQVVVVIGIVAWVALMVWLWIALVRARSPKLRVDLDAAYLEAADLSAASPPSVFASLSDG